MKIDAKPKINNVWSEKDIEYVTQNASKPLQDFIFLAVETGLRRCDLIRLTFDHIHIMQDRRVIVIDTQKTGQKVLLPCTARVNKWLDGLAYCDGFILRSTDGTKWHEDKFNHAWQRLKKSLKLKDITPHGLRKTAVTRLAKAGCTLLEISALLGWSLKSVQGVLDQHYFKDKLSVATLAMDKLDALQGF